ncbi:hypothetical protein ABN125_04130 [Proteus terrae]|uniref:hypothetical protein n=1 Tax=Proteus terrae TaxID=1574161 RepID=UPI0032DB4A74
MHGSIIFKSFSIKSLVQCLFLLIFCSVLNGCSMFYGIACSTSILFTPSESQEKIYMPEAVVNQDYDQQIEIGVFSGLAPYYIVESPEWVTVTFMVKNKDGVWLSLITHENWQKHVMHQEERPIIFAHLQGTAPKSGNARIKIKATVGRTMCGTTEPVFALQVKVRKE